MISTPEELAYFKEIFLKGFWLGCLFNLFGLIIRLVRLLRRPGTDVLD